jgi:hypothetical protein
MKRIVAMCLAALQVRLHERVARDDDLLRRLRAAGL